MKIEDLLLEKTVVKKSWDLEKINVKDAINLLNKHCKQGLVAIANDGLIFRGFKAKILDGDTAIVDTSESERTSRDSDNLYNIMMDASAAFKGWPSRSHSLICTTRLNTARTYGNPYVVFPFDKTTIAFGENEEDFMSASFENHLFPDSHSLENFVSEFTHCLKATEFKLPKKFFKEDIAKLDEHLRSVNPLYFMCGISDVDQWIDVISESDYQKFIRLSISPVRQAKYLIENPDSWDLTPRGEEVFKLLKSSKPFSNLCSSVVTPSSFGDAKRKTFGESLGYNEEVWFSGKCVVIEVDLFREVLKELRKNYKFNMPRTFR
jgi:hypothetical protein